MKKMKYNQQVLINNELCNIKIKILHEDYDNVDLEFIDGYVVSGELLEKLVKLANEYNVKIDEVIKVGLEYI